MSVINTHSQFVWSKTAKYHGVDCTQSGTGQHGDGRFGHHWHINHHAITFFHTQAFQSTGKQRYLITQFTVGVGGFGVGNRGIVDQRGLFTSTLFHVIVETQITGVQLPVGIPAKVFVLIHAENVGRLFIPGNTISLFLPELFRVFQKLLILFLIGINYRHIEILPPTLNYFAELFAMGTVSAIRPRYNNLSSTSLATFTKIIDSSAMTGYALP